MGIRNREREVLERLDSKTLDARFTTEIQQGLNCSPFEAEAVLDVVKEVYFPFLAAEPTPPAPGRPATRRSGSTTISARAAGRGAAPRRRAA